MNPMVCWLISIVAWLVGWSVGATVRRSVQKFLKEGRLDSDERYYPLPSSYSWTVNHRAQRLWQTLYIYQNIFRGPIDCLPNQPPQPQEFKAFCSQLLCDSELMWRRTGYNGRFLRFSPGLKEDHRRIYWQDSFEMRELMPSYSSPTRIILI